VTLRPLAHLGGWVIWLILAVGSFGRLGHLAHVGGWLIWAVGRFAHFGGPPARVAGPSGHGTAHASRTPTHARPARDPRATHARPARDPRATHARPGRDRARGMRRGIARDA